MRSLHSSVVLQAAVLLVAAPAIVSGEELITRDQVLETAYLSYAVEFRIDADNVYAAAQIEGATCAYEAPGWQTRLPYAWYGHDDLYEFLGKLMDARGAGDVNTKSGQPYTKALVGGVECSGYVGECWKIPGRLFTKDLARDALAAPIPWEALAPGDIVNAPGRHVRLVEAYPYDGDPDRIRVFESTTAVGRGLAKGVIRRVLPEGRITDFKTNYVPRRYVKISSKPSILSVRKAGEGRVEIRWLGDVGNEAAHPESGFRVYQSADGAAWTIAEGQDESRLKLANQSTTVSGLSPDKTYYFRITAVKSGQESQPSKAYAVRFASGRKPQVLIVDGFDKWFFKKENRGNRNHDFALCYARELDRLGISFETVDNLLVTRSADPEAPLRLQDYRAVVTMLGDEGEAGLSRDYSLNILEQLALAAYLRDGGHLLLSGSQLSEDLNDVYSRLDNIRMNDATFCADYLRVPGSTGNARTHAIASGSGIFADVKPFGFDDGSLHYDVAAADVLQPGPGAATCLSYEGGKSAAIQYAGTFGGSKKAGKIVYLGFPFESIVDQQARAAVMTGVMEYFGLAAPRRAARPSEE